MGSRYTWTNDDGLLVNSGRRTSDEEGGRRSPELGYLQKIEVVLKQGQTGDSNEQKSYAATIPSGARIVDAEVFCDGAGTSLVDLIVGIADADGGSDLTDADGLVLAMDAAEITNGTVVGTAFDGAVLTSSTPLSEDVIVTIAATTASAAGDIKAVVTFAPAIA